MAAQARARPSSSACCGGRDRIAERNGYTGTLYRNSRRARVLCAKLTRYVHFCAVSSSDGLG